MNRKIIDAIYSGASMGEICKEFDMTPDFVMNDWTAWRERQEW